MNKQVEVEGGELAVKNSHGDIAIIPKKYRLEAEGMIKDGCNDCLDSLIANLPSANDYAVDGTLYPEGDPPKKENNSFMDKVSSTINPKNWGVTDYSGDDGTRTQGQAYKLARDAGESEFMYNNERFNTKYEGTPKQQLSETGITDDQIQGKTWLGDRIHKNIVPVGYTDARDKLNSVITNTPQHGRDVMQENAEELAEQGATNNQNNLWDARRMDAFNLYMGKPQINNTFGVSDYKPSVSKDENNIYYSMNNNELDDYILNNMNEDGTLKSKEDAYGNVHNPQDPSGVMGHFQLNNGEDEKGKYVSYYDKWDLNASRVAEHVVGKKGWEKINSMFEKDVELGVGKSMEIYNRRYYKENKKMSDVEYKKQKEILDKKYKEFRAGNFDEKKLKIHRDESKKLYEARNNNFKFVD
jgi:hypothetical protein